MTFDAAESSLENSQPVEIYEITLGSQTFRFTSAEDDVTVGSDTFTATEGLSRSSIVQAGDSKNRNLTLTMRGDNDFAKLYRNSVPGVKAIVNLWRLQRTETPTPLTTRTLFFKGLVQSVRFPQDGYTAEVLLRSIEDALNRNIPRYTYGFPCQHVLYDTRCGVDPTLFNNSGVVSVVNGNTITVPGLNVRADGFFTGGYVIPLTGNADFRLIIGHTGNDLDLLLPFSDNVTNVQVQAFAGCNHLIEGDCATKFDNVAEYGGFGFVPNKNIFSAGL